MTVPASVLLSSAHHVPRLRREPLEHHSAPKPSEVLPVNGLFGYSKLPGDLLPGPTEGASAIDVQYLELLEEPTQGRHRPQALARVLAPYVPNQLCCDDHGVSIR